jgi:hypothetical protein
MESCFYCNNYHPLYLYDGFCISNSGYNNDTIIHITNQDWKCKKFILNEKYTTKN